MFVGYYKCDKCGNKIEDVLTVRRWLINGQYSTEELPQVAKEYLLKKEFCNDCAKKLLDVVKDWYETPLEELERRRTTTWVYVKDKLPEVEEGEDPEFFVALKEGQKLSTMKYSEIIEDQKEKHPEDEESEEGPHLIYAWAETFSTPDLDEVEVPEEPVDPTDPVEPTDPDDNNGPDGPDQNP